MKPSLLLFLQCPDCEGEFSLKSFEEEKISTVEQTQQTDVISGLLVCSGCNHSYPIIDRIPRFIPNAFSLNPNFLKKFPQVKEFVSSKEFVAVHGSTQERFGYEWMRYPGAMAEDREVFLNETQIKPEDWKGRVVLDAGCGMGRYSRVAHSLGSTVVAFDLSGALVRLQDLAKTSERMHLIQGNLMRPPLKKKIFDIVYSIGVIHHTPSAKETFVSIARRVKVGGSLSVWVYGAPGRYEHFKTNPLRSDRQALESIRFWVWLTVVVREKISDTLRVLTTRLPHAWVYGLSYPLALIGKIPLIKYLTFSVHPMWRVRVQENFDWLSPPYQSHHTKEELRSWFEAQGFTVQKTLPHGFVPKPGILGIKSSGVQSTEIQSVGARS